MKLIAPDYYRDFRCIADKCRHSCCIGWEIDIDPGTRDYYDRIGGELGKKLKENIADTPDGSSFITDSSERCPFLMKNGLCELITELGEDSLCDICAEHPRFYNEYGNITEAGLGLCCEEAAKIILNKKGKTDFIILEDDGENCAVSAEDKSFFELKSAVISALQDESLPLVSGLEKALSICGEKPFVITADTLPVITERLEFMGDELTHKLSHIDKDIELNACEIKGFENKFRQLAVYFAYRHLNNTEALTDKMRFTVFNTVILGALFDNEKEKTTGKLADLARLYSSEIEYSDLNEEIIVDFSK